MTDDLVTIASFSQPYEAQLARGTLEASGIESVLRDEHTVGADWFFSTALGGVKIQVRSSDVSEARRVLEPVLKPAGPRLTCPHCESGRARRVINLWPTMVLLSLLAITIVTFGLEELVFEARTRALVSRLGLGTAGSAQLIFLIFMFFRRPWRCLDCGHTWKTR
jgi:hypothetical protein